jgi:hypothetical protein
MRAALIISGALFAGCWGSPVGQAPECQAWVACVRARDADAGETTDLGRFDDGGFCWNNPTLGEGCTTACRRALTRMTERGECVP